MRTQTTDDPLVVDSIDFNFSNPTHHPRPEEAAAILPQIQPQQKNEEEGTQKQGSEQSSNDVESQEQIEHDTDGNVEENNDTQNQDLSQVGGTVADEERGKSDDKVTPETEQIQDFTDLRIDEEEPKQEQTEEENGSHQPEQQIEEFAAVLPPPHPPPTALASAARNEELQQLKHDEDALQNECSENEEKGTLAAAADLRHLRAGEKLHSLALRSGFCISLPVSNSLINMYGKCLRPLDANKVFEEIDEGNEVSWCSLLHGLVMSDLLEEACKVFEDMPNRSLIAWNIMIMGFSYSDFPEMSICLFRRMVMLGFKGDVNIDEALNLFQAAPENNIVSWTSIIAGFARNGYGGEALYYFVNMQKNLPLPDEFTFGIVHACATLTVLGNGLMVHGCTICHGFEPFVYVSNGLVNMYAKCDDIRSSSKVFDEMIAKDLVSCNAMIFGFAVHGWAQKALKLCEDMIYSSIPPDKFIFFGLLMACCHSGLVKQGMDVLSYMESVHGVSPDPDHLTCVVDMLSRAGCLRQANILLDFIEEKHVGYCEALLCGSSVHGDGMLSNLYCFNGQWKDAEEIKKAPGCSWIEVRDVLMIFGYQQNGIFEEVVTFFFKIFDPGGLIIRRRASIEPSSFDARGE